MKEIRIDELGINPFESIGKRWMLITAGNERDGYNTMTASWGGLGVLWGRDVSTIYIRPQRYTKTFVDREDLYTISFYPEDFRKKLAYLGSHSGRDEDKVAKMGMTPHFEHNTTWFEGAELVMVCRKLYRAPILEDHFIDKFLIGEEYPNKDFHDLYVGEIINVLVK